MKTPLTCLVILSFFLNGVTQVPFSDFKVMAAPDVIDLTCAVNADIDGDGLEDIICGTSHQNAIVWFRNMNGSEFSERQVLSSTLDPVLALEALDVEGDNDIDLITVHKELDSFMLLKNNGDGTFAEPELITNQTDQPKAMAIGDLDGDFLPDLVTCSWDDEKLAWHKNLGSGTFGEQVIIAIDNMLEGVELADMDGDNDLDVVTSSRQPEQILWYENDGLGEFPDTNLIVADYYLGQYLEFGDAEGDGDLDLLTSGHTFNDLKFYENAGDGLWNDPLTLQEFCCIFTHTGCWQYSNVHFVDLDGDNDLDVCGLAGGYDCSSTGLLYTFENYGNGVFSGIEEIPTDINLGIEILVFDIDLDGDPDLVTCSKGDGKISYYKNQGDMTFGEENLLSRTCNGPINFQVMDFDHDGDNDLISVYSTEKEVRYSENVGQELFGDPQVIYSDSLVPSALGMADFNNDGWEDLLIGLKKESLNYNDLDTGYVRICLNDQSPGFPSSSLVSSVARYPTILLGEYVDGDDDLDLIFSGYSGPGFVGYIKGDGNGSFQQDNVVYTMDNALIRKPAFDDIDLDGDLDFFVKDQQFDSIFYCNNMANGVFAPPMSFDSEFGPVSISFGLFDENEFPDILLCNSTTNPRIYLNPAIDGFESAVSTQSQAYSPSDCQSADLNGDGFADYVQVSLATDSVHVFVNDGALFFQEQILGSPFSKGIAQVKLVDVDLDNDLDIVTRDYNYETIGWYENLMIIAGCTDPAACNFNSVANADDGSCFYSPCINVADSNNDGLISIEDLLDLLGGMGCMAPPDCPGDIDGDGVVSVLDLLLLLGYFGQTYP